MTYPAVIFLALLIWSFTWPKENLIYLVFGSVAFGSLAVIPPELLGGMNLLPTSAAALVMIGRHFMDKRFLTALPRLALKPERMGLLTGFIFVAVISALFFPRLFAGQVDVVPMRGERGPLGPSMANFTQLAYLLVSYLIALIFGANSADRRFCEKILRAALIGGGLVTLTGLLDLALGSSGGGALLAPFKTAEYTFMIDNQVLGFRRVVGVMTEASAYGSTAVAMGALILFTAPLHTSPRLRLVAQLTGVSLVIMAMLSTSSTAYVGVAVLGVLYLAGLARRTFDDLARSSHLLMRFMALAELFACYLVVVALAAVVMLTPDVLDAPVAFIDELIFKKSQGASYADRMSWNVLALQALGGTGGLGVGVGGARTSNWAVAVLSNTGLLGAGLLFGFLALQFVRRAAEHDRFSRYLLLGSRSALVVNVVMAGLAGTSPDFGVMGGALYGLIAAQVVGPYRTTLRRWRRQRASLVARAPAPTRPGPPTPNSEPAFVPTRTGKRVSRRIRAAGRRGPRKPRTAPAGPAGADRNR